MRAVSSITTPPPSDDINEYKLPIPMRDGYLNTARIRQPKLTPAGGSPLIVLAFGGGFIAGDNHQMATEAQALVQLYGAVVVNISYRLAPEHKFPCSWEDSWDNLVWLAQHGAEIGADLARGFVVGGTSAGAKVAAACARKAQVEPLAYPLTGQWLYVPWVLEEQQVPEKWSHLFMSRQHNKDAPILCTADLEKVLGYTGLDSDSPWASPVRFDHPLAGLPKTYIQVDGMDPLRDDGLLYDEMLKEAGVASRCDLYPGVPHAHAAFMPGTEIARKAVVDLLVAVGWMLNQGICEERALEVLATK